MHSSSFTTLARRARIVYGIGIVEGANGDDHVNQDTKNSLEVITLAVTEEVTNHQNSENEDDGIEDLEVQVERVTQTPCDDYNERSIEESGLNGCAEDMGKGEVHLVVPSFIDGCDVFGSFFDNRNQNETNEAMIISHGA